MVKERLIFILGIFTALLSFSGFPAGWKKFLFAVIGLSLAYLAYLLYKEKRGLKANTASEHKQAEGPNV